MPTSDIKLNPANFALNYREAGVIVAEVIAGETTLEEGLIKLDKIEEA